MSRSRIYLDHAATSWPKPAAVLAAMDEYARRCGATAGRGLYQSAQQATEVVRGARQKLARLINAESASCISFHSSGTLALNVAIAGLIQPGDHVVTTAAEHNSVLRPLHLLQKKKLIRLTIVPCDVTGTVSAADIGHAIGSHTRLVAVTHASNVTGAVQPIGEIGKLLRDHQALLLCDAAQTLGYVPIDVRELGVDLLAAPGHKGANGPLGTGMLYVHAEHQDRLEPLIQGGTGSHSDSLEMPVEYPDKVESGNLNVPAIAGWSSGLDSLLESSGHPLGPLAEMLYRELRAVVGLQVFGTPGPLPVVSVSISRMSPSDVATILDTEFNIETRSGFHCAALIHRYLNSGDEGTLRISGGHQTREHEIESVCQALRAIVAEVAGTII